ncbi:hypothetical protein GO308_12710 [Sphingomonas sp. SFZ2018-12]|uniref:hypothetical protein n=1 Tax=Sphingomonas sp. SFZ2018-12 TaxID=2683197 RepID=UPI001F0FEF15|nr:hypothetical protein [Sphingomonas sp. SFZ2018-12]MCH4893976.1 hypothetical protein [Sphingomonas sp. SFZ2018-12]
MSRAVFPRTPPSTLETRERWGRVHVEGDQRAPFFYPRPAEFPPRARSFWKFL